MGVRGRGRATLHPGPRDAHCGVYAHVGPQPHGRAGNRGHCNRDAAERADRLAGARNGGGRGFTD